MIDDVEINLYGIFKFYLFFGIYTIIYFIKTDVLFLLIPFFKRYLGSAKEVVS